MSADVLREAARLMRERAESATPGRWFVAAETLWTGTAAPHECLAPVWTYDGDAEQAASWHPAVALAVAHWLDSEARNQFGPTEEAINVAAAYLGAGA